MKNLESISQINRDFSIEGYPSLYSMIEEIVSPIKNKITSDELTSLRRGIRRIVNIEIDKAEQYFKEQYL